MGQNSMLRSPKKEEQLVPDSVVAEFFETINGGNTYIIDEFEGILGIKDEELAEGTYNMHDDHELNWDFMEWEEFSLNEEEESEGDFHKVENSSLHFSMVKSENCGFLEDEYAKKMCLNLSLNYQDVMDAWSEHRPLWAQDTSLSPDANNTYKGEVPVMEEDRTRREASVIRYKEKRQNRLFSKKIRYQVRKLNAEKRPRLKGRFVKRDS